MKVTAYPKYTIIVRGYSDDEVTAILAAMEGLESHFAVEITMNTPGAAAMIKVANKQLRDKLIIGAGTVISWEAEVAAIRDGAKFILSAFTFSREMIAYAKAHDVITVPGVMTPSEVSQQLEYGADIVKIFPATTVGPKYFKDIQAPLGKLRLMAVGGISKENIKTFMTNGASYVGIGSGAFNQADIHNRDVSKLHQSLLELLSETK